MPDGTIRGLQRGIAVQESSDVGCPRCDRRLRVTVGEGVSLVTCEHKTRGATCAQKYAVVGLPGRVCIIVALTGREFSEIQAAGAEPGLLFRKLGLVGSALMPAGAA